jgi:ATP-dependent DNA helicase RecG
VGVWNGFRLATISLMLTLATPVKFVRGVGERIGQELGRRGVATVEDLLYHLPFRYEDRLNPRPLADLKAGEVVSVIGEVRGAILLRTRGAPIFEIVVGQGLSTVKCLWFHGQYLQGKFHVGQMVAVYGRLEQSRSGGAGKFKMVQPTFELLPDPAATGPNAARDAEFVMLEMGRIVPVYESLGGTSAWGQKLGSRWLRRVMWTAFEDLMRPSVEPDAPAASGPTAPVPESLPTTLRERLGMPGRLEALAAIHFPETGTPLAALQDATTPAHRRLIFEEFWYLELGLELKRRRMHERAGTAFVTDDNVRAALKQILPFRPTAAQKRVLGEIVADMRKPQPMRRLLQGDVGSGKTIVALEAALVAIENGYQVALMAPTEILATQHYLSARKLLGDKISPRNNWPYRIALLTGSLSDAAKRETRGRIARGEAQLVIGTHALQEQTVDFNNLGLVIVDEQHRFGVEQRFRLMKKPDASGMPSEPDVLVMTATPIPRTLALTVYGDLEASILDELPPGRTPIATRRMPQSRADEVWQFVRKQVAAGQQAYVVYPVIEGDKDDHPELDFATSEEDATALSTENDGSRTPDSAPLKMPRKGATFLRGAVAPTENTKGFNKQASLQSGAGSVAAFQLSGDSENGSGVASKGKAKKPKKTAKSAGVSYTKQKLRSATEMFEELSHGALAGLRLGLLHGRMSADDKDVTMARFKRGEIDVLISTTVIEVGVDVPNASVMVIEHAERFGLAQLHQLRGRVGRGVSKSVCVLLTGPRVSAQAEERLDAMVATQDGFALAELDLKQRGPGEFFGTRQAGMPELRVANLVRDRALLELAKAEANRFAEAPDPAMSREEIDAVWSRLKEQWQRRYGLVEA